jgi:hypothetical protein
VIRASIVHSWTQTMEFSFLVFFSWTSKLNLKWYLTALRKITSIVLLKRRKNGGISVYALKGLFWRWQPKWSKLSQHLFFGLVRDLSYTPHMFPELLVWFINSYGTKSHFTILEFTLFQQICHLGCGLYLVVLSNNYIEVKPRRKFVMRKLYLLYA